MRDFMFGAKKKKKNTKKIRQVSGSRISGTAGAIPFKFDMYGAVYEGIKICRIGRNRRRSF